MIETKDNRSKNLLPIDVTDEEVLGLESFSNISIDELIKKNPNLLVFPPTFNKYGDDLDVGIICSLKNRTLKTGNIMGFIGNNEVELKISSRFYSEGNDYFLHYMLQKVLSLNILDLKHSSSSENIWDFLLYLFPYYFKKALRQGLYKEYVHKKYNDSNIKGPIDIARHIKVNRPFIGKVSYCTKEHSYDNAIIQLVRHTIEFIQSHRVGHHILNESPELCSFVRQIKQSTESYNIKLREKVIHQNLKPFRHPFYHEYRELQKLCLMILRREKLAYGRGQDKVYGLLFDGAWLWEEYLNTLLKQHEFIHPCNKLKKHPVHPFKGRRIYPRYPDFYSLDKDIVLDAKYKNCDSSISRDDLNQIITYLYILSVGKGGLIYPKEEVDHDMEDNRLIGTLNGYDGKIYSFHLDIPLMPRSYMEFREKIRISENKVVDKILASSYFSNNIRRHF